MALAGLLIASPDPAGLLTGLLSAAGAVGGSLASVLAFALVRHTHGNSLMSGAPHWQQLNECARQCESWCVGRSDRVDLLLAL